LDRSAQIAPDQKLHHHKRPALLFAVVVNADDVFVLDVACHTRFVEETLFGLRVRAALVRENFYGDGPADDGIARTVDVRHAAAEKFLQFVLPDACRKLHYFATCRTQFSPAPAFLSSRLAPPKSTKKRAVGPLPPETVVPPKVT
jgi:hypothetical protein